MFFSPITLRTIALNLASSAFIRATSASSATILSAISSGVAVAAGGKKEWVAVVVVVVVGEKDHARGGCGKRSRLGQLLLREESRARER